MIKKLSMLSICLVLSIQLLMVGKLQATNTSVQETVEIIGLDQLQEQALLISLLNFFENTSQLEVYQQMIQTSFEQVDQNTSNGISDIQELCTVLIVIAHEHQQNLKEGVNYSSDVFSGAYVVSKSVLDQYGFPDEKIYNHQIQINTGTANVLSKTMRILINLKAKGITPSVFVLDWENENLEFQKNTFNTYYQLGKSVLDIEMLSLLGSQDDLSEMFGQGIEILNIKLEKDEKIKLGQFLGDFGLINKESATVGFTKITNKIGNAIFKSCTQLWE